MSPIAYCEFFICGPSTQDLVFLEVAGALILSGFFHIHVTSTTVMLVRK